jgi:uncharacterized membrane protein
MNAFFICFFKVNKQLDIFREHQLTMCCGQIYSVLLVAIFCSYRDSAVQYTQSHSVLLFQFIIIKSILS